MPDSSAVAKTEITDWLKTIGKDRPWLATQLKVSLSIVHQWMAPRGSIPEDRLVSIRQLMAREDAAHLLGDPEGNLISFTIDEFERIEATRQRLHYDARPPMYRDAILAFIEADEARNSAKSSTGGQVEIKAETAPKSQIAATFSSILPPMANLAADDSPSSPPVTESRHEVSYTPKKPKKH